MSIELQQHPTLEIPHPITLSIGIFDDAETPTTPTKAPEVPTFTATPGNARIVLAITAVPMAAGYRYRLQRRQGGRWARPTAPTDLMTSRTATITRFNQGNAIVNNQRYRVSVQAYNAIGNSDWSRWLEVRPRS